MNTLNFKHGFYALFLLISISLTAKDTSVDLIYPDVNQVTEPLALSGTIKSKQQANVTVLEQGVIAHIFVEAGQNVNHGDQLLELNNSLAKAQLAQAKATLEASKIAHQEAVRLYQEALSLSKQQVVAKTLIAERAAVQAEAEAQLAVAKALFEEQQEVVNRHRLTAPFSGVISKRHVEVGEWLTPQSPAFSIVANDKLRLELAVPQEYFSKFQGNQLTVLVSPELSNFAPIELPISQVIAAADEMSRTFTVFGDITNNKGLISGVSARALIRFSSGQQQLWLPKTAIKHHPDGGYSVFSVTKNVAKRHLIQIVDEKAEQVAVINAPSNLAFVVSGVEALKEGMQVSVASVKGSAK